MRAKRDKRELAERSQTMLARRRAGATLRQIGQEFGISEVRVAFILERENARQEFELTRAQMGLT